MHKIHYTETQKEAINHRNSNLLILACAGSGKTEVISRRIAGVVREGAAKANIVAFAFTEHAAGELKARIRQHLEDLMPDDPALGDMFVGTIHSFCLETLRGLDGKYRRYEVMDDARQAALVMTNFHHFPDNPNAIGLDRLRNRCRGNYWETIGTFLRTLNVMHQKGIAPDKLNDPDLEDAIGRYRNAAYGHPNFFFDFDRIIEALIDRLRMHPPDLEAVRRRLRYLVVDEYQDIDERQEELIGLLTGNGASAEITVVGDDDQAIYGWRGAQIRNILTFESRYPNVHKITLNDNFRSTHGVAEIANAAIGRIPPNDRIGKKMVARRPPLSDDAPLEERLTDPHDIQLRTFPEEKLEAEWVAERIQQLLGVIVEEKDGTSRAINYGDMAILLRSVRKAGRTFAETLRQHGIPTVVKGAGGLFDNPEVRLVYAGFCLLARSPYVNYTEAGQERIENTSGIREEVRRLVDACGPSLKYANTERFLGWTSAKREELDRRNVEVAENWRLPSRIYPQDIFQEMLRELGAHTGEDAFDQAVLFNWGRLSELITQFESVHQWVTPAKLGSLCLFLSGWAAGSDEGALDESFAPRAVQIMTVHAAKGLEWPVVFLPRVSSSNFPSSRRYQGPDTFLSEDLFDRSAYASGDDGERRLWYVALTRCRKFLNITSLKRKGKQPSPFFKEISHHMVVRDGPVPDPQRGNPQQRAPDLLPTTYSDMSTFWRCEFEYQLRSVMGFSPGVAESYGYGQQIHNILAEVHKRALEGEKFDEAKIDSLVEERFHLRYTKDGEHFKPFTALKDAAKAALARYVRDFSNFEELVLAPEKPFEFVDKDSGAMISGTIDLLERVEKTLTGEERHVPVALVDFKTTRVKDPEQFEDAKRSVERQLQLYAVAVRHAFGMRPEKARAHFLSPHELGTEERALGLSDVIEVNVSETAQSEMRRQVHDTVQKIQTAVSCMTFNKTGIHEKACRKCDFREICYGYVEYKRTDMESPRLGTYEEERGKEIRQVIQEENVAGTKSE